MEERLEEKDSHVLDLQKKSKVFFLYPKCTSHFWANVVVSFKVLVTASILLFLYRKPGYFSQEFFMKTEIGRCIDKCEEAFFIPSNAVDQGIQNDYHFTIRDC